MKKQLMLSLIIMTSIGIKAYTQIDDGKKLVLIDHDEIMNTSYDIAGQAFVQKICDQLTDSLIVNQSVQLQTNNGPWNAKEIVSNFVMTYQPTTTEKDALQWLKNQPKYQNPNLIEQALNSDPKRIEALRIIAEFNNKNRYIDLKDWKDLRNFKALQQKASLLVKAVKKLLPTYAQPSFNNRGKL